MSPKVFSLGEDEHVYTAADVLNKETDCGETAVVIGGVVLALFQRIQEIGKGEEDDARQF